MATTDLEAAVIRYLSTPVERMRAAVEAMRRAVAKIGRS